MMVEVRLEPEMEGVLRPSVEAMVLEGLSVKVGEGLLKTEGDVGELLRACVVWMERVPGSMALGYLISATLGSTLAEGVLGLSSMKGDFFFSFYYLFFQLQRLGFFFFLKNLFHFHFYYYFYACFFFVLF